MSRRGGPVRPGTRVYAHMYQTRRTRQYATVLAALADGSFLVAFDHPWCDELVHVVPCVYRPGIDPDPRRNPPSGYHPKPREFPVWLLEAPLGRAVTWRPDPDLPGAAATLTARDGGAYRAEVTYTEPAIRLNPDGTETPGHLVRRVWAHPNHLYPRQETR